MKKESAITVNQMIDLLYKDSEYYSLNSFKESLLRRLEFYEGNEHLQHVNEETSYIHNREVPLKGDELVYGDYLLYDCCGHNEMDIIWKLGNLKEVEEHLLDKGGLQNPFTTEMIVIEYGKVKEYEYDKQNNTLTWL